MDLSAHRIRQPAVAGAFYPASADDLSRDVRSFITGAAPPRADAAVPKALIAPHAGYIYSGAIAANAYARLASARGRIHRVVLLGPAHRVSIDGLALPDAEGLQTPLGVVPVDQAAVQSIAALPQVSVSREAHAREHALEVHLPFLQSVLGDFSVVPLVVGRAETGEIAQVLDRLWGGDETLIVISSDLSHYLTYEQARTTDHATVQAILQRRPQLTHTQACGATPVNGLLAVALQRGLRPELLDLRNSGDTAGDRSRVVGYASIGFYKPEPSRETAATDDRGATLIGLACGAIGDMFGMKLPMDDKPAFLHEPGATFVTLMREGKLRGCIGTLRAYRPVLDDVKANAKSAAFLDPRFSPLTQTEFATTSVEVSLLDAPEPMTFTNEADALAQLRPGVDGLILECGSERATFLPQVWETLPAPADFLRHLKRKANLDAAFWSPDIRLLRYGVAKYTESA